MSICRMRMKVDLGGLKITPKMKRFMCVEVGRTSTMIQWWGHKLFFFKFYDRIDDYFKVGFAL